MTKTEVKEEVKKEGLSLEEIKGLNIYEKLSLITDEIGVIEKNLNVQVNKTSSYKAVSERDVLDAVKPIERKYRVYSFPIKRNVIDRETLVKETEFVDSRTDNTTTTRTNSLFMRIETIYRFVNIDKPEEFVETTVYGDGVDTGDKAPGKAMTYADKYALMKAYKLSTGDDPDKDASPENGYQKVEKKISPAQKSILDKLSDEDKEKVYKKYNVSSLDELDIKQASELISKLKGNK